MDASLYVFRRSRENAKPTIAGDEVTAERS